MRICLFQRTTDSSELIPSAPRNSITLGWIEEVPGVNSQGKTRDELLENLRNALDEALEINRAEARAAATGAYEEVSIPK